MIFNLKSTQQVNIFNEFNKDCIEKGLLVESKVKREKRSLSQNAYLHVLLNIITMHTGEDSERVKQVYYKQYANNESIFWIKKIADKITGEIYTVIRSSTDLDSKEMSESIENLKAWTSFNIDLILPEADNYLAINEARALWSQEKIHLERYKAV